jgi:hypothetical protein
MLHQCRIAEIEAKRDFSLNVALRCSSSPPVRARGFGMWRFIVEQSFSLKLSCWMQQRLQEADIDLSFSSHTGLLAIQYVCFLVRYVCCVCFLVQYVCVRNE